MIVPILQKRKQRFELNDLIKVICLISDLKIKPVFRLLKSNAIAENTVKSDYYRNEMVLKQNYAVFPKAFSIWGRLVASRWWHSKTTAYKSKWNDERRNIKFLVL